LYQLRRFLPKHHPNSLISCILAQSKFREVIMAEKTPALDPVEATLRAFAISNRIQLYLLDNLAPEAWALAPPSGKGRTLAAMAAHIHNVRLMWLKAAKVPDLPASLEKTCTIAETRAALESSATVTSTFLRTALETGRVPNFKPDAWAFAAYLVAHEAHHRGQMTQLARQLGYPVSQAVNFGLWQWGVR
jgi:uncharacterized damage-inducible protein DinB